MQNNLKTKTCKPTIKDAEPNKYVLEVVKSRDLGHSCFNGHVTYFLNFGTRSITFEREKFWDTSFFLC